MIILPKTSGLTVLPPRGPLDLRFDSKPARDLWLVVTGCRELTPAHFNQALAAAGVADRVSVLIVGDAPGIDAAARAWARALGRDAVALRLFAANWTRLGSVAGPIRNSAMIKHAKTCPDPARVLCLGVLNDLSRSENAGTRDALAKAQRAQVPVRVFAFDKDGVMREEASP